MLHCVPTSTVSVFTVLVTGVGVRAAAAGVAGVDGVGSVPVRNATPLKSFICFESDAASWSRRSEFFRPIAVEFATSSPGKYPESNLDVPLLESTSAGTVPPVQTQDVFKAPPA